MIMFIPMPMHMSGPLDPFSFICFMVMLAIMLFIAIYIIIDIINMHMLDRWHRSLCGGSCSYTIFVKNGKVIKEGIDKL